MYHDSKQCFLVMQCVPSMSLDKLWPSLAVSVKDDITVKLRRVFDIMRQAKSPFPDTFASLDGGPVPTTCFAS